MPAILARRTRARCADRRRTRRAARRSTRRACWMCCRRHVCDQRYPSCSRARMCARRSTRSTLLVRVAAQSAGMSVARNLTALAAVVAAYAVVVRPRMLRSGATDAEVGGPVSRRGSGARQPSRGDNGRDDRRPAQSGVAVAGADGARPRRLVSWDQLDNFGMASDDRIHPEWRAISVGDRAGVDAGR